MDRPKGDHSPTVHMIGNAHIDPVWLWRRDEGRQVTLDTFRTVVDLMDEYPEMTFTSAQAQLYAWVEEAEPEVFDRIRELVSEGRWHIVGGMWVQPDCNLPSGEAFVRQLLYGQGYFRSRFGMEATVGYNVDSFGHAGTLPQLLAKGGLDSYVYFRPDPEREVRMDEDLYWWEAPDGSRVLACRPPNHYCTWAGEIEAWIVKSVVHTPERAGGVLCFYGVGDHGGGPTRENLDSIERVSRRPDLPPVVQGSLRAFFDEAKEARHDYSVRRAELQHHAPGCYSVQSDIKRWNRFAEQRLVAVEKANAVAAMLAGEPVAGPRAFDETWRLVLFNQFHDILAGSSIPEAYEDAATDFDEVTRMCAGIERRALERLAAVTDCRGDGRPMLLFNPCSWNRQAVVARETDDRGAYAGGVPLPTQRGHDGSLLVGVELPAIGATCMHLTDEVTDGSRKGADAPELKVGTTSLDNQYWRLELDADTGEWISLRDKAADLEVLARPGNALVVLDDPGDTWSHGVTGYHTAVGCFGEATIEVIEEGPLRASLRVSRRFGRSIVQERVSLYAGRRDIEVESDLDWHDTRKALKVSFPLAVEYPVCSYEAPYGVTVRLANGDEDPGQSWVDATGVGRTRDGKPIAYGLSLINDSKYGFDMKAQAGGERSGPALVDVRMTILRSPPYAFHDPRPFVPGETYTFVDQGRQKLAYWVLPHEGSWQDAGTVAAAHERNAPILSLATKPHGGILPSQWSAIVCPTLGVEIGALKAAEQGEDLVLRLHETSGRDRTARVEFPVWGQAFEVPIGHHEVKSLLLKRDGDHLKVQEVNLLEQMVENGLSTMSDCV